jgi:type IV secretory pathway VirB10-like protein
MTETSVQTQLAVMRDRALVLFGSVGFVAILLSGCAARKNPTIHWNTAVLVRPIAPQRPSPAEVEGVPVPDIGMELPPPPAPLATRTPPPPARPHNASPTSNSGARTEKPDTPQIVPELSTQESASLQRETNQGLAAAERNLAATSGKSLSATQSDLASKVRSFISDARESGRAGDWTRARDLAKKAQVLSEELVGSL